MKQARLRKGIELCFDERGSGEPVVMIMGIGVQMIYWHEEMCDLLADAGFRVIRFDNRDVGQSTYLTELGVPPLGRSVMSALIGTRPEAPYTLEDMADDTAQLLDFLEIERAHVVGASLGGMIAQTMAFTHPDRVMSLTSIMSTTGARGHFITEPRALRALLSKPPRSREEAMANARQVWGVIGSTGFELDEEGLAERAGRAWDRGFNPAGFLRQFAAMAATGDRTARLRFVRAPTHVIHGTVDPLIRPIGGQLTARAIGGATLDMIEGMGHDLPRGVWPRVIDGVRGVAERAHRSPEARARHARAK